jgi:hypothetical protein
MTVAHTPVSILLLHVPANICIEYTLLPAVCDTLTIHYSEATDVCVHFFFVLPNDGLDEPKHVG